ncbi:sulfatase-like hydrolase/transferase [Bacterioplanoides sp.]|uniref:sulfatase-like hydrolase/transferase n=1 Tax=Bacterioplanoides sp. TaxID=2066072 RepID=UPI003B58E5AC
MNFSLKDFLFIKLLLFYLVMAITMVCADPGISNWIDSLAYDLKEGDPIAPRIIVLLATSAFVCLPLMVSTLWLRLPLFLLFVISLTIGISFRLINGQFSVWEATLFLNEFGFAGDAINEFLPEIAKALAFSLVAACLLWLTRPELRLAAPVQILLFAPLMLPVMYLHIAKGGYWITHFAMPLKVPSSLYFAAQYAVYQGDRDDARIIAVSPVDYNIILIVDESIRGDWLSINNPYSATTPYLERLVSDPHWSNFGVVSSMSNCSASANLLLRSGVPESALPEASERLFKDANLFQYASAAGFETHYFDGQVKGKRLNNYFTRSEIADIDQYKAFRNVYQLADEEIDQHMAVDTVKAVGLAQSPLFIYINKVGTHFPYELTYPQVQQNEDDDKPDHYRKALSWSVDHFMQVLVEGLQSLNEPSLIFYTSDHGQGLGEMNIRSTHCLPKQVPDVQARVPLLVGAINMVLDENWQSSGGEYSQFQLFPSVIKSMGLTIDMPDMAQDLSTPWEGKRLFLSGDITGRGQLSRNPFKYRPEGEMARK